jgi:hypothetical protein
VATTSVGAIAREELSEKGLRESNHRPTDYE